MELQTIIFIFTLFVTFASFKRHPFQIKVESIDALSKFSSPFTTAVEDVINNANNRMFHDAWFIDVSAFISAASEFLADNFGFNYVRLTRSLVNSIPKRSTRSPHVNVEDTAFDGVPVRVYIPEVLQINGPAVLYIHGGGWMFMSIDTHDAACQHLAIELRAVVVSVGYRLAPEHPYPASLDDCFVALRYFMRHSARWHVNSSRIAVAGDSTGGHLAAVLAIRWRDQVVLLNETEQTLETNDSSGNASEATLARIRLQILIYPLLQIATARTSSMLLYGNLMPSRDFVTRLVALLAFPERVRLEPRFYKQLLAARHLTRATRARIAQYFAFWHLNESKNEVNSFVSEAERNTATQLREQLERAEGSPELEREVLPRMFDPMYSPLFVESLAELPPAYVVTAGRDIFRDEALAYVRRMRHAKEHSTVAHRHYTNDVHGFMTLDGSNRLQRDLADFLDAHPYFL